MIAHESDFENGILEIIEDLKNLVIKHSDLSKLLNKYKIIFNSLNYFISASTALSMTLIAISPSDQKELITTVIGSSFAFLIGISTRLKDSYNFEELIAKHKNASIEYYGLKQKFGLLLITENKTVEKYLLLLELLNETKAKNNIEEICYC